MTTARRVSLFVVIVLTLVALVFSILGIYFAWRLNTPLTQSGQAVVSGLETSVSAAEFLTARVKDSLGLVESTVNQVSQVVSGLGEAGVAKEILLIALPDNLTNLLVAQMEDIRTRVINLYETVRSVNQALLAIDRLPLISVPTLEDTKLVGAAQELQTSVDNLKAEITQTRQAVTSDMESLANQLQAVGDSLGTWRMLLGDVQSRLNEWSVLLAAIYANLPVWIDWISISLTILLLIDIFALLALLLVVRTMWVNPRMSLHRNLVLAESQPGELPLESLGLVLPAEDASPTEAPAADSPASSTTVPPGTDAE